MATATQQDVRKALGLDARRTGRIIKYVLALAVVIGVVLGARAYLSQRAAAAAPKYRFESVQKTDLRVTVSATGRLQGLNTVEVGAEVTGKVLRVLVDFNETVKRGQVLAELDPQQPRAATEEASAQLAAATASVRQAETTVLETRQAASRAEEQSGLGLISARELEAARASAARAEANVESAKANARLAQASLSSAQSRLGKTTIVAPIDGVVLSRTVEPGQTVTSGFQTPILFKLAEDLSHLSLRVDVDESDVGRVHEGASATFTVDAYPARSFASKVIQLRNEPKTSQNVVTYEAVLAVDNADRLLRPGMTATATIVSEERPGVVTVPNAALRFTPPVVASFGPPRGSTAPTGKRVYTLVGGVATPVDVKTGQTDGQATELVGDTLAVGTEVIVDVASSH